MLNESSIKKLEAWVEAHPESADSPFMNVATGQEFTVRGLLNNARASMAGEVQLTEALVAEFNQLETWLGGL